MAIGDFYTTRFQISGNNSVWEFGLDWLMYAGAIGYGTLGAMNAKIKTQCADILMLALPNTMELDNITTRCVTNQDDIPGVSNYNNVVGALIDKQLPSNIAACIKQTTDAPNARHNGRMFLAGVPEGGQASGVLTPAQKTLFDAFAQACESNIELTTPETAEFYAGVISRYEGKSKRPTPVFFRGDVYTTDVNLRQQRRRTTERKGIST